jgi:hypothetical protein
MKLVICKPQGYYSIAGLLREFWALHGIHVSQIHTSYNDVYGFWDVTFSRGLLYKEGRGRGSLQYQRDNWSKKLALISELHGAKLEPWWEWLTPTEDSHVTGGEPVNGRVYCPGARLFLSVGSLAPINSTKDEHEAL